jgi:hypothetical protein
MLDRPTPPPTRTRLTLLLALLLPALSAALPPPPPHTHLPPPDLGADHADPSERLRRIARYEAEFAAGLPVDAERRTRCSRFVADLVERSLASRPEIVAVAVEGGDVPPMLLHAPAGAEPTQLARRFCEDRGLTPVDECTETVSTRLTQQRAATAERLDRFRAMPAGACRDFGDARGYACAGDVPLLRALNARSELAELAHRLGLVGQAVEVGVHRGEHARAFLGAWAGHTLHLVDAWTKIERKRPSQRGRATYAHDRNDDLEATLRNVRAVTAPADAAAGRRFRVVRALSVEAAKRYADGFFDLVYLDASHEYHGVRTDLQTWWPKLRRGGLMAGDDYMNGFHTGAGYSFGVRDAVDEFAAVYGLRVHSTGEGTGQRGRSWYFLKC